MRMSEKCRNNSDNPLTYRRATEAKTAIEHYGTKLILVQK